MMSRHFRLSSELSGAIAERPRHAKCQPCSAWYGGKNDPISNVSYLARGQDLLLFVPSKN